MRGFVRQAAAATFGLLTAAIPPPSANCSRHLVRTARSNGGLIAQEAVLACAANPFVVTGQNEIYVSHGNPAHNRSMLIASFDNIGAKGAPLSWAGTTLIVHLPTHHSGFVDRQAVAGMLVRFVRDYSDRQFIQEETGQR